MKHQIKLYLEQEDISRLKQKAVDAGLEERGCLTNYIRKVARTPIIFLTKEFIELLANEKNKKNN